MSLEVYYDLFSQPSRAVVLFCKVNRIPFTPKPVALKKCEYCLLAHFFHCDKNLICSFVYMSVNCTLCWCGPNPYLIVCQCMISASVSHGLLDTQSVGLYWWLLFSKPQLQFWLQLGGQMLISCTTSPIMTFFFLMWCIIICFICVVISLILWFLLYSLVVWILKFWFVLHYSCMCVYIIAIVCVCFNCSNPICHRTYQCLNVFIIQFMPLCCFILMKDILVYNMSFMCDTLLAFLHGHVC